MHEFNQVHALPLPAEVGSEAGDLLGRGFEGLVDRGPVEEFADADGEGFEGALDDAVEGLRRALQERVAEDIAA